MTSLILTGSPWCGADSLFDRLTEFGLQPAAASNSNHGSSIHDWHQQVFSQQALPQQQLRLGKAWEQLAGEVFRANWQQNIWGWAEHQSTWLLEFWRDFDPDIRFILLHTKPELAVARAITQLQEGKPFSCEQAVGSWLAYERELLRFYLRNPERCLLIDSEQAYNNSAQLVDIANKQWGLGLKEIPELQSFEESVTGTSDQLAVFLALELIKANAEVQSLSQEITASLSIPQAVQTDAVMPIADVIVNFQSLVYGNDVLLQAMTVAQEEQTNRVLGLTTELEELTQDRQALQAQVFSLCQIEDELEQYIHKTQILESQQQATAELTEQQQAEIHRLTNEYQQHQAQVNNLQQENELLLLQLHQVQEELEQYFLKAQTLEHEHQANAEKVVHQHAEIQRLTGEQQLLQGQAGNLQQENELLLLQLRQVQEELEQYFLRAQAIEQEQHVNTEQAAHQHAEIQRLTTECQLLQGHAGNLQQENELLLLQLHQVQEELEHYFLQYQQEQKQGQQLNQRLTHLFERWPDLIDMESLRIESGGSSKSPSLTFKACGVYHPRYAVDEFAFKISVQNKLPAIVIEREDNQQSQPLLRWPTELANQNAIVIPMNVTNTEQSSAVLSTSDWKLLSALTERCGQAIQNAAYQLEPAGTKFDARTWQAVLAQFNQAIKSDSNCLRYDNVNLKRKKAIAGYEYLWLECSNLSFNGKQWRQAEFRFSAAEVNPKIFSVYPRLEFQQIEGESALLENWKPDIQDESGARMEFRFETQSQQLDMHFWNSLSENDKALVLALIWHLPIFLADLEAQQLTISRPWADWQRLAQEVMSIIKLRLFGLGKANAAVA